jgi:hypothetical protein
MSMVAKSMSALAASALLTAFGHSLVGGLAADLLIQPHFWVISVSLAGLIGLATGSGIGGDKPRANVVRMVPTASRPAISAVAA